MADTQRCCGRGVSLPWGSCVNPGVCRASRLHFGLFGGLESGRGRLADVCAGANAAVDR